MSSRNRKNVVVINKQQPIPMVFWLLVILVILFLLAMTSYFITAAVNNMAVFRDKDQVKEEITEFSTPLFQDGTSQTTGETTTTGTNQQRSNATNSNTSTTRTSDTTKETTTNNNNTTETDNNDNFIEDTTTTVTDTVNDVSAPTDGLLDPIITQAAGVLDGLFGN